MPTFSTDMLYEQHISLSNQTKAAKTKTVSDDWLFDESMFVIDMI